MAGKIKQIVDEIIDKRSKGSMGLIYTTKAKLLIKGIHPDTMTPQQAHQLLYTLKDLSRQKLNG